MIDLTEAARRSVGAIEDGGIGRRRIRQDFSGRCFGIGAHLADELAGATRTEEMREIKFGRPDLAADAGFKRRKIFFVELARHLGGNLGVLAQTEDRRLPGRIINARHAVAAGRDMVGIGLEAILGAVRLHHLQPGLLGELEQAGGAAGA